MQRLVPDALFLFAHFVDELSRALAIGVLDTLTTRIIRPTQDYRGSMRIRSALHKPASSWTPQVRSGPSKTPIKGIQGL